MARVLRLSQSDDDELMKRGYIVGTLLGEGSYAKVKSAMSEKLNKKVALKIISRKKAPTDFQQKFLPRELETIQQLNHPHIVKLYDVINIRDKVIDIRQYDKEIVMVLELAGHGDLLEYIKLRGALPDDKARRMFSQLLSAVAYMHSLNIVHRDLKCENVLLDVDNNVKLTDFGFSRTQRSDQLSRTYCGSAAYASPEVLQGIPYNGKAYDVWSLGVILYIMVCGSMPFDDTDVKKMIRFQTEKKVGFSRRKIISQDVKNLIHGILNANVEQRLTVRDISNSVWINSNRGSQTSTQKLENFLSKQAVESTAVPSPSATTFGLSHPAAAAATTTTTAAAAAATDESKNESTSYQTPLPTVHTALHQPETVAIALTAGTVDDDRTRASSVVTKTEMPQRKSLQLPVALRNHSLRQPLPQQQQLDHTNDAVSYGSRLETADAVLASTTPQGHQNAPAAILTEASRAERRASIQSRDRLRGQGR